MSKSFHEAKESEEYTDGKVVYLRGASEADSAEGYVRISHEEDTDFAVVVKEGGTDYIPMERVVRIRLNRKESH